MTAVSPDELAAFKDKQRLVGTAEAVAADFAVDVPRRMDDHFCPEYGQLLDAPPEWRESCL